MAMAVSRDNSIALTISADHLIGRYGIVVRKFSRVKSYIVTDAMLWHFPAVLEC